MRFLRLPGNAWEIQEIRALKPRLTHSSLSPLLNTARALRPHTHPELAALNPLIPQKKQNQKSEVS